MQRQLKTLVLYRGRFSGATESLIHALGSNGCEVLEAKASLRNLHYRIVWVCILTINALLDYGARFRKYINRTYAAYACISKANENLVRKHSDLDVIVQIGANFNSYWKKKNPSVLYTLFTDHTNLLSKKSANVYFHAPECDVKNEWNIIEKKIFDAQDHIFVMGSHVKQSLVQDYGIDTNKVSVIGAGPNLDLDIERDRLHKSFDSRTILFVGIDSQRKGLNILISAFNEIVKTFPDAHLDIAGVNGANTDNITYYGLIRDNALKQLFYDAQIFALPTFREPFGIVLLEAMFAKCVCIATQTGAIPEIIEDTKTGFLIDAGDVHALQERIVRLFSNPAILSDMAEEAYRSARKKWTWKLAATKMIQQINKLIAKRRPGMQNDGAR